MNFYPAHAIRHCVTHEDIWYNMPFSTYEAALEAVRSVSAAEDDWGVFVYDETRHEWIRVLRKNDGSIASWE